MDAEKKRYVVKLGEVEVDLTEVPPLTLGDRKALKGQGVDFLKYARDRMVEPEDEAKMVLYVLQRMNPKITMEQVDAIPALVTTGILNHYLRRSVEVDDPFSMRLTSSVQPTAGEKTSSPSELKPN